MRIRRYIRPNDIDNLEPPPEQIAETAEVIQEATKILSHRWDKFCLLKIFFFVEMMIIIIVVFFLVCCVLFFFTDLNYHMMKY